jgi:DNA repair protein RAD50
LRVTFFNFLSSNGQLILLFKRKLSSPDYKNVDEKFRIALIDVETTQIASEDLKKYGNALDKAILKFHHVKIDDINKIVRELWLLTYKGERGWVQR